MLGQVHIYSGTHMAHGLQLRHTYYCLPLENDKKLPVDCKIPYIFFPN